jgi:quercetin dioxygenase-like cupin family protein
MPEISSVITRATARHIEHHDWGRLEWMASGALGNSTTMTVGRCYIDPGQANPRHYHPNCDEILHILQGVIEHTLDNQSVEMRAGDTISIPQGTVHNAHNIGDEQAIFVIAFSSPDRRVIGE